MIVFSTDTNLFRGRVGFGRKETGLTGHASLERVLGGSAVRCTALQEKPRPVDAGVMMEHMGWSGVKGHDRLHPTQADTALR